MKLFYEQSGIQIYHGDCREILSKLGGDVIITDPPYGETALHWDRWVENWLPLWPGNSLWIFGTLRMFMAHQHEFSYAKWKFSQDIIWEKHNGSGLMKDRFRRIHEQAAYFYRPPWKSVFRQPQYSMDAQAKQVRRKMKPTHWSKIKSGHYESIDGGPRLLRSVFHVRSEHGRAMRPTQKPLGVIEPLIEYSCPPDGLVVDPFCGSGSTLLAAYLSGRKAIGIDVDEQACSIAAERLKNQVIQFEKEA